MEYYNYSVDLPYTKSRIHYREINTQEQILLAKANITFSNDKNSLYDYNEFIFDVILNCIKNKDIFSKINIIEYVLFLVKLRSISIGPTIEFLLNTAEKSKTKTKIQIDLRKYLVNLYNASKYFETDDNSIVIEKDIELKLNWPNLKSIEVFNKITLYSQNEYEILNNSLCEYVEYIKIGNNKIIWDELDREQKIKLFDKFPLSLKNKVQNKVLEGTKMLFEYDLFQVSFFNEYKFNFYNLSFLEHIKMFFSYDLKSLYHEIYFLSTYKLPPQYILNISQSERKIYTSIIEEQNKKKDGQTTDSPEEIPDDSSGYSDAVKKLALEFGQDLSK